MDIKKMMEDYKKEKEEIEKKITREAKESINKDLICEECKEVITERKLIICFNYGGEYEDYLIYRECPHCKKTLDIEFKDFKNGTYEVSVVMDYDWKHGKENK